MLLSSLQEIVNFRRAPVDSDGCGPAETVLDTIFTRLQRMAVSVKAVDVDIQNYFWLDWGN